MGYYNLELYPISKKIFTIVTLWVKCEYQKLLTGVCNIPNIFQENIPELLEGFDMVQAYIDNILVITKDNLSRISEGSRKRFTETCGNRIKVVHIN